MADSPVPTMQATLQWDSALEFTGEVGKHEVGLDGASYTAPSPMQMLALSLAGCMAIDLVHILTKGRHALTGLEVRFTGERAQQDPKRFVRVRMEFALTTGAPAEAIDRALQLSKDKYCSVWNSLNPDTALELAYTTSASAV